MESRPSVLFSALTKNQFRLIVSVDGVNGPFLILGSMSDVSTNGNWPTTFDVETK